MTLEEEIKHEGFTHHVRIVVGIIVSFSLLFWLLSGCAPAKEQMKSPPYFRPITKLDTLKHGLYLKNQREYREFIQEKQTCK